MKIRVGIAHTPVGTQLVCIMLDDDASHVHVSAILKPEEADAFGRLLQTTAKPMMAGLVLPDGTVPS